MDKTKALQELTFGLALLVAVWVFFPELRFFQRNSGPRFVDPIEQLVSFVRTLETPSVMRSSGTCIRFNRGNVMAGDRKLAEVARSIHRASERLWARVVQREKYDVAPADVETLQRLTTELSRAITKLKLKGKK